MTKSEPTQALTLRPITVGRKSVPADSLVWVLRRMGTTAEVEIQDERGTVPADALVDYPAAGPGLDRLRALDPCFGLPDEAFDNEHLDPRYYFTIVRCRAHGRRFLRDVRGGIGMYEVLTLLDESDQGSPFEIWTRYHNRSHAWLMWQGRTL
jgi:hypothetical protein